MDPVQDTMNINDGPASTGSGQVETPDTKEDMQASLIKATQRIAALHGMNFSTGALRDLPEIVYTEFGPEAAVSALGRIGFNAQFGELSAKKLHPGQCPAIGFDLEGTAFVVLEIDADGIAELWHASTDTLHKVPLSELAKESSGYFILSQKIPPKAKSKKNDWFWGSFSNSKWLYTQVILAAMLTNFLGLSTSLFIMVVYDRVVPNEAIESLIALTIGVLIALGFDFVIKTLRAQFVDYAGRKADQRMSRLIFDKILTMRVDSGQRKSGALASVVREFDTLREFFTSATLVAVVDLPFIFFFIWVISLISGPLAIVPLIAVPLVIFSGLVIQPMLSRIAESSMQSGMTKQAVLVETLNGLETVQATGSGRLMRQRFEEATSNQSDLSLRSRTLSQFAINSAASIQQLAQIATIFYGVFLIQENTITMGALIAAVILGGRTLAPLSQLAAAMTRANSAKQAFVSLSNLMSENADDASETGARLSRPHLSGQIELKSASYKFEGASEPILNNVSIKIPAGQKVVLLGRMGSGKSTLARLMAGIIPPSSGSVMVDNIDIRQIDKSDLRRNVGVMLQETWLFSGSVRENLQMGFAEYDDEHLLNIAKVSGVDDFVSKHPAGYDMQLKERGVGLSGGQRQSINLARALLHNPNILILDEPTSAMDNATEKLVVERLKSWTAGRTVIAVTHRNALLELADRVLVVENGKIISDTTPDNLKMRK